MSKLLKEKDDQINQLMEEGVCTPPPPSPFEPCLPLPSLSPGEKLSMQELQSNGSIKKLRLKERQNDQLLTAQRYATCTCTCMCCMVHVYTCIYIAVP